jgi:hypothetical protein
MTREARFHAARVARIDVLAAETVDGVLDGGDIRLVASPAPTVVILKSTAGPIVMSEACCWM